MLGCPNWPLALDRFLDSQCQSRLSQVWWRGIVNEKGVMQACQLRSIAWQSPLVLRIFWRARRPWASPRKRLMRALHAGSSSRQARRRARMEPALAPPAGESWRSCSAQVNTRCTCIKRALVRTLGGAKQAKTVCLSLPETHPQADKKCSKAGWGW